MRITIRISKKINSFLINKKNIFIILSLFLLNILLSSCDVCETAEDMEMEEFQIKVQGNSSSYDDSKPQSYWISSGIFVKKVKTDNNSNQNIDQNLNKIKIKILSNDLDLCFNESSNFNMIHQYNSVIQGMPVSNGEVIEITPIKEKIIINDCDNPPADIFISDIQKCRNGYTKNDQNGKFIEKAEGKTIEIESYIVNENKLYNAIISKGSTKILPGKKLVIPEEFEYTEGGKTIYSFLPQIPEGHKSILEQYKNFYGKSSEQVTQEYWCRKLSGQYSTKVIPTENINGLELNKFCENFYFFDKVKYTTVNNIPTIDKNNSDIAICPNFQNLGSSFSQSTTKGNTNLPRGSKIFSFITNGCIEDFEIEPGKYSSILMTNSRFLYGLELFNFTNATIMNTYSLNEDFNLNPKNLAKLYGKIDANNKTQIPLEKQIFIEESGILIPKFQFLYFSTLSTLLKGQYNFKITKSCKAKKIHVYFSKDGSLPKFYPNQVGSASSVGLDGINNVKTFDLIEQDQTGNLVYLDEISINLEDIPSEGWMIFGLPDNGDGYQNNNGVLKMSIKRQRNKGDIFFNKILNTILNNIENLLFGNTPEKDSGVATIIFKRIVKSSFFRNIINTFLLVFITAYGLMIVAGFTQFQAADLTKTALKIGFVYSLLMPQSWEFFHKYLFSFFIKGPNHLLTLLLTSPDKQVDFDNNKQLVFGTVSDILSRITDLSFFKQLTSLIFAFPFGWIACVIIFISFIWLIYASFSAILIYIISMTLISLFISVAPLFIMTLMFKYTQKIFIAWFKVLISNLLTLIFTFVGLYAIGTAISIILDDIFSFGVCTKCVFAYDIGPFPFCMMHATVPDQFPELRTFEDLQLMQEENSKYATGGGLFYGIPIGINKLLALLFLSYVARKSVDVFAQLANEVSDIGFGGPGGAGGIASGVEKNLEYWFGEDKKAKNDDSKKNKGMEAQIDDDSKDSNQESKKKGVKRK